MPRGLPEGRLLPSRDRVDLGLLSTHGRSAEGWLFKRQSGHKGTLGTLRHLKISRKTVSRQEEGRAGETGVKAQDTKQPPLYVFQLPRVSLCLKLLNGKFQKQTTEKF